MLRELSKIARVIYIAAKVPHSTVSTSKYVSIDIVVHDHARNWLSREGSLVELELGIPSNAFSSSRKI